MARHLRARAVADALAHPAVGRRWHDVADDPNDPAALVFRADRLRAAWRPPVADRVAHLEEVCRGRSVLDIGCVAHDVARLGRDDWLHGRIARAARSCLGVDVLPDGVEAMQSLGYRVVCHDLRTGPGPVADDAPFEVIVAGELIEHVPALDFLLTVAAELLTADGRLVVTTPNPYAPLRVAAGQAGIVWENTDHLAYLFPSGMAELCERHGLVLAEARVTVDPLPALDPLAIVRRVRRRLAGTAWRPVGFATRGDRRSVVLRPPGRLRRHMLARQGRVLVGETFVYTMVRSSAAEPHTALAGADGTGDMSAPGHPSSPAPPAGRPMP